MSALIVIVWFKLSVMLGPKAATTVVIFSKVSGLLSRLGKARLVQVRFCFHFLGCVFRRPAQFQKERWN